jgi:hypothetical protein
MVQIAPPVFRASPMARSEKPKVRLSVIVSKEQKTFLKDIAKQSQVSLALVIREAVREFITNHQDRQLPLFKKRLSPLD